MPRRKLAIFDVDGTIFRWSLFIEIVEGLIEKGYFPQKAFQEINARYLQWMDRKIHYNIYLEQVIQTYYKYLKGCKYSDVEKVARHVILEKGNRVYRYTSTLKKKGYFLLIISGSPEFIVQEFARLFGFDQWYGSIYEVKNGIFTGAPINRDSVFKKGKVLDKFLKSASFQVDLKNSIAVGDTASDAPLLERVGKPIAFDPDRDLLVYANKKKWKIILERKDVIYEVKSFKTVTV